MEKKLQKLCLTNYNLLMTQYLWQVPNQILLIILLKEFIKLNVNIDIIIKHVKRVELNTNIVSAALNTQTLKMIEQKKKISVTIRITKKKIYYSFKRRYAKTLNFPNHDVNKIKTSLPEKENFYSHLNVEDITDADYIRLGKYFEKTKEIVKI